MPIRLFHRISISLACLLSISAIPASQAQDPLTRLAFGSCNRQDLPQPLWTPILKFQPQAWIWLGDNIYGDTNDMEVLENKWTTQKTHPDYTQLRALCPVIGIWDDHDYGRNNAGFGYPFKKESQKLFLDFLDEPTESPRRNQAGIYATRTFGPPGSEVRVILLDGRSFRGAPKSGGDILGETQWIWLTEILESSTAQVHLICSGSQILPTEHRHEKWADYPDSRKRLLDMIAQTKKSGVLFLSGDRHMGEISRLEHAGTTFTEVTSSGMTHFRHDTTSEKNSLRLGEFFAELNFGTLEIDWGLKKITIAIRDSAGSVVRNTEVRF